MMVVGIILIGLVVAGTLYIGVSNYISTKNKDKEEKVELPFSSKNTKDLVKDFTLPSVGVNPDYTGQGVTDVLSPEEYRQRILDSSEVLKSGTDYATNEELSYLQSLLNEFISNIPTTDDYSSSSQSLSQFAYIYSQYFDDYRSSKIQDIQLLLLHNEIKIETLNVVKTSSEGTFAYEFVISDLEGKQLAYVTGIYGGYLQKFTVSDAFPLGYGQSFINENIPQNLPPRQGL